jgi:RNA 2',3'-cyclic 3'-phosphodiesterase
MRLFAALPLPSATVAALAGLQADWREAGWPLHWVRPASLHITLRFFGEVTAGIAQGLGGMLDEAARGTGLLVLEPVALRPFPGGARARLVWLELGTAPALELLAHRVEQGSAVLGLPPACETFRPHVTLARVAREARLPREAADRIGAAPLPDAFSVDALHLMESHLGSGPPRYDVRHVSPLAA